MVYEYGRLSPDAFPFNGCARVAYDSMPSCVGHLC